MNKEVLTRAFEKLGPEKVARGLLGIPGDNRRCFLARAFGPDRALLIAAKRRENSLWRRFRQKIFGAFSAPPTTSNFGGVLGLELQETLEVMDCFDNHTAAFGALAQEWLEWNRTSATPKVLV